MSTDEDHVPTEREEYKRKHGPRRIRLATGERLTLPTSYLSPSQAEMYIKCPRQYWFRYICGEKRPPAVRMVLGTAGHHALWRFNYRRMKSGEGLSPKKTVDAFLDKWLEVSKEIDPRDWSREGLTKDRAADLVVPSLTHYAKEVGNTIFVVEAERQIAKNVKGVPVVGVLDLRSGPDKGSQRIDDYKFVGPTSGYLKPGTADHSLQLGTYGVLGNVSRVGYICLVLDKTKGRVEVRRSRVEHARRVNVRKTYVHVAKGVSAGAFPQCPPGSWYCSPKWCGFWADCRGSKKPREP